MSFSLVLGRLNESVFELAQQSTVFADSAQDGHRAKLEHVLLDRFCDLGDEMVACSGELAELVQLALTHVDDGDLPSAVRAMVDADGLTRKASVDLVDGVFIWESSEDLTRLSKSGHRELRWVTALGESAQGCWSAQKKVGDDVTLVWSCLAELLAVGPSVAWAAQQPEEDS